MLSLPHLARCCCPKPGLSLPVSSTSRPHGITSPCPPAAPPPAPPAAGAAQVQLEMLHLLELSWHSIDPQYGRPLGSFPRGQEPNAKGYGKSKDGGILLIHKKDDNFIAELFRIGLGAHLDIYLRFLLV